MLLPLLPSEDVAVAFHEFAHQQETVNGGNAIGYETSNKFPFATGLLGCRQAVPEVCYVI